MKRLFLMLLCLLLGFNLFACKQNPKEQKLQSITSGDNGGHTISGGGSGSTNPIDLTDPADSGTKVGKTVYVVSGGNASQEVFLVFD